MGNKYQSLIGSAVLSVLLLTGGSSFAVEFSVNKETSEAVVDELMVKKKRVSQASASKQAKEFIGNKTAGWDNKRKQFIAIGVSKFDSEDPSYDDTYITQRSLASTEAVLLAKEKIIRYIGTKMSAANSVNIPGHPIEQAFGKRKKRLVKKLEAQKKKLIKLLESVNAAEADVLKGVTLGDRMNTLMDAAIKKLDQTYSVDNINQEKQNRLKSIKEKYLEAKSEKESLDVELEKMGENLRKERKSTVQMMSEQPLYGALTVASFESWNENKEQYEVAVIVTWSFKSEKIARAIIQGEQPELSPGSMSLSEWLNSSDWSASSGGRKFKDNKGEIYFVGIGSSELGESSSDEMEAAEYAQLEAASNAAMALFSEVVSESEMKKMSRTYTGGKGKDITVAAKSLSKSVTESIEDREIKGLSEKYSAELVHPISQQPIYVSIYAISISDARDAGAIEERNKLTRISDIKSQQRIKAKSDAMDDEIKAAQRDHSVYDATREETAQNMRDKAAREDGYANGNSDSGDTYPVGGAPQQYGRGGRAGVYSGGGQAGALDW